MEQAIYFVDAGERGHSKHFFGSCWVSILFDNAARDASAAAARGRRLVRVVVAAGVDHDRAPFSVGQSEVRYG
jgi:hypothetical protein